MQKKRRNQKPIKGGRIPTSACVNKEIEKALCQEAREYNCSKSFVQNTILAHYFRIRIEENYND